MRASKVFLVVNIAMIFFTFVVECLLSRGWRSRRYGWPWCDLIRPRTYAGFHVNSGRHSRTLSSSLTHGLSLCPNLSIIFMQSLILCRLLFDKLFIYTFVESIYVMKNIQGSKLLNMLFCQGVRYFISLG